jgi:hypothetical protein
MFARLASGPDSFARSAVLRGRPQLCPVAARADGPGAPRLPDLLAAALAMSLIAGPGARKSTNVHTSVMKWFRNYSPQMRVWAASRLRSWP